MAHKFSHQACGTVLSSHYCIKKMSWSLNVVMTSSCHVSAGPLHPTNLLNQNEVNIMQWYSQMSGTNKPEWASVLLFWSMYTFSWIAIKHFWLWLDLTSYRQVSLLPLTNLPWVLHICISELGQHWFRQWLVACSAPSHYLNQCSLIVNWTLRNKLRWNWNKNMKLFIYKNVFKNVVCKMAAILSMGDEFIPFNGRPCICTSYHISHLRSSE